MSVLDAEVTAESAGTAAALVVSDLRVSLAAEPIDVVADVSFQLQPGEILGLVGESGSGKTTIALALLGYARPGLRLAAGSIVVDGVDMMAASRRQLRALRGGTVSYVPQDPSSSLNPTMRIGVQLMDVLREHDFGADDDARSERVTEMLQEVSLPADRGFLHRYPHELSGGQQQRIGLAMAFSCRPRVVVLDEPTTGLDVTTQANVLRTIRDLASRHRSAAVYVSHDLAVVAELAHRIAVMYAGRVMEQGPAADIFARPVHPYTRKLIQAVPSARRREALVGIPGHIPPLGQLGAGCRFASRCEYVEEACRVEHIEEELFADSRTVRCRRASYVAGQLQVSGRDAAPALDSSAHSEQALVIEDLKAGYGKVQILHGVSLSLPKGSCLAVVGESGSGKTTLARAVSGLHRQTQGRLSLNGQELPWPARRRTPSMRRSVQYVFQNPYGALNPRKTVRELLEQPLKQFSLEKSSMGVPALLDRVSLPARYAGRYPSQLSGGERQRVAIARALAVDPEVLVCDEITSALDVSVQASILNLLLQLRAQTGLSLLFVTHNLAVVRAVADNVIVVNKGHVVENGATEAVLEHPTDSYTQALLRDTPGSN